MYELKIFRTVDTNEHLQYWRFFPSTNTLVITPSSLCGHFTRIQNVRNYRNDPESNWGQRESDRQYILYCATPEPWPVVKLRVNLSLLGWNAVSVGKHTHLEVSYCFYLQGKRVPRERDCWCPDGNGTSILLTLTVSKSILSNVLGSINHKQHRCEDL
jgi:hypothetical protein